MLKIMTIEEKEKKRLQAQLQQAQKMEAIATLGTRKKIIIPPHIGFSPEI